MGQGRAVRAHRRGDTYLWEGSESAFTRSRAAYRAIEREAKCFGGGDRQLVFAYRRDFLETFSQIRGKGANDLPCSQDLVRAGRGRVGGKVEEPRGGERTASSHTMEGLPRHTQTVELGDLVERVIGTAHDDLVKLAESAPGRAEEDRKRELARYLHTLRQRLTRLAVLAEWAPVQRRAKISILCGDMLGQLKQHDRAFADAADRLFGLHQQMAWARAPLFDLPGALDVLCNGEYSVLPASIGDVAPKPVKGVDDPETDLEMEERLTLEKRLEREMRSRLLDEKVAGLLPDGVKVWAVSNGVAVIGVPGEYRATVGLGGPPPLPPPGPPPKPGEEPVIPTPLLPPPHGGWLVRGFEMLAGARDIDDPADVPPRAFTLTKLENRVLGERATARMAGMSPPPPAAPELVENGAEGIAGLHRVGRDAALRLVAATIAEQTKRVALKGGAWTGGGIRVEPIKRDPDAMEIDGVDKDSSKEKVEKEKTHGKGEGIRVWFWLPGSRHALGAAGTRLAGVDVGSVEVAHTMAAANDAAVAAGTAPRIELLYEKGEDLLDGRIVARALVLDGSIGDNIKPKIHPLPFDMSSVDVREALTDGVRAGCLEKLQHILNAIDGPIAHAGLAATLEKSVTRPSGTPGNTSDASQDDEFNPETFPDEDGWGDLARPAIVVTLTDNGTTAQVCCDKRTGSLAVVGISRLASPAAAAAFARTVRQGGISALPNALVGLVRLALESDLRAAMREHGLSPCPAPKMFQVKQGMEWPQGGSSPAAVAPVAPSSGGLFVAAFVTKKSQCEITSPSKKKGKTAVKKKENQASSYSVCLALLRARRSNPAAVCEPASYVLLSKQGELIVDGNKKTDTSFEFDAHAVAKALAVASSTATFSAQRLAVCDWLDKRNVAFSDVRPIGGTGDFEKSTIAWHARLDEAGTSKKEESSEVLVEIALGGASGVTLTVRSPNLGVPYPKTFGESGRAAVAGCGGDARSSSTPDGKLETKIVYPGETTPGDGALEFSAGAACADAHRVVSMLAFAKRITSEKKKQIAIEEVEALSFVVSVGKKCARIGWSGPPGPTGGLAAVGLDGLDDETEAAVSEAARVGDVNALLAALAKK